MRDHRITKTCFRTCSTCRSRSQAPLCLCTLRLVSNQPEGTFARLRYSFGGDRPSQTTHQTVSPSPDDRLRLDIQEQQGWYFKVGSTEASAPASKPPTYPTHTIPRFTASYSKGSRGLSVLLRVDGIFTAIAISLSPWLRQCGNRYAIRAGRNLPDKEFRYLRTVIVTAAVYRGFGSSFALRLTAPLNLPAPGRRQTLYVVLRLCRDLCF